MHSPTMMSAGKVLAITKRTAHLCGTQAMLYGAGLELVTTTNPALARNLVRPLRIKGVIVCRHSWSDEERDAMVADFSTLADVAVTMRCPGCTGCDESADRPGALCDTVALTHLIDVVGSATVA